MKFQKHLEWHRVPDWRDAYVNYKQLKKDIKRIRENGSDVCASARLKIDVDTFDGLSAVLEEDPGNQKLRSFFSTSAEKSWFEQDDQEFMVVHQRSSRTYTEDEIFYETELLGNVSEAESEKKFFTKLDSQLNMINNFYKHKESEYISHAQLLQNQLDILFKRQEDFADIEGSLVTRATKLLRAGFMEFYRSLGYLRSYILLNRLAFQKILKKHDKVTGKPASDTYLRAVHMSYFSTSDKIVRMMEQVKSVFTDHFAKGDRRKALACLQPVRQRAHNISFALGLFTGCSCSLLVTFALLLVLPHTKRFPKVRTAFPIFSTMVLFLVHMYMYACNMYMWRKARINYPYMFGFQPRTELKYQDMLLLSTLFTMLLISGLVLYLTVSGLESTSETLRGAVPVGVLLTLGGLIVMPINTFYRPARYVFLRCLIRIIFSPLFKVALPDFFLADQVTSQVTSLKNIGYTLCYYGGNHFGFNSYSCSSKVSFQYPLVVLPYWWRLMQCLRRYVDLRDAVQLANAGKYLTALVAVVMKVTYKWTDSKAWKLMFVFSSFCATLYQLYWDLVMDCGLLQRGSMNRLLRDNLMLERKLVYYMFMVLNVILRVVWLFSLFQLQLGATDNMGIEFILALVEVFRRGMWNFFRLENEHINNVGKFRAIKVIPLPFEDDDYADVLSNATPSDIHKRASASKSV